MDTFPEDRSDPAPSLPRAAFQEILHILRGALPPPCSDDPADEIRRDRAAMAAVAALLPEDAAEGRLAAQFVAADAWAMDCLRLAGERRREFEVARKCRAQAMSLMREGKGALRLLLKLQAARRKTEADPQAAGRAAWVQHAAVGMMEPALAAEEPAARTVRADGTATTGGKSRHASDFDDLSHDARFETSMKQGPRDLERSPPLTPFSQPAWVARTG